jgi:hypothetical protein
LSFAVESFRAVQLLLINCFSEIVTYINNKVLMENKTTTIILMNKTSVGQGTRTVRTQA